MEEASELKLEIKSYWMLKVGKKCMVTNKTKKYEKRVMPSDLKHCPIAESKIKLY